MASQDSHQLSQQNSSDLDPISLSDSPLPPYAFNSSQYHQQDHMSQSNPFVEADQYPNQFTPINLQFQRNFTFNPMTPFSSQAQQLGSGFPFQGLMNQMNCPNLPFENQTPSSSKGSKKKGKAPKKSQTPQVASTRRSWTMEEDIALTRAWLYISVDADVGNDQKLETMWNHILKVWRTNMGVYDESRHSNALQCHWVTIQGQVSKFHGFYEQLERQPQSGSTPEKMKEEALRMFKALNNGQYFKYEHCWEILKNNPKWCSQLLTKPGTSKKQKSVNDIPAGNPPQSTHHGDSDTTIPDPPATESTNSDGVERPEGRKAVKEKKKRAVVEKGVVDALGNLQGTLEKQLEFTRTELELKKEAMKMDILFKERNQRRKEKAQKRKDQERILCKDLTNLQPVVRESLERMQANILKEWENDGIMGEVFECNDSEV